MNLFLQLRMNGWCFLKYKPAYSILLFLLLTASISFAQVTNIGKVVSWKKTNTGIEGKTATAFFKVQVHNNNTIRVRVSLDKSMDEFSYALVDQVLNEDGDLTVIENTNSIRLQTKTIDLEVEKTPAFRLIFRNKQGKVINEDVAGEGFGTSFIGNRSTLYKKMQPGERFVGLGEVLGNLDKRGSGFTLNNTDTYKYGDPRLSMYTSIPFYIGIHQQEVYGIFYHNTYKTFFNFGLSTPFTSITAGGGAVDYFFIYGTGIAEILKHYTSLTGRMPLPPIWSLGYHQSRCSYFPQENVKILAETFRKKNIPADCIVLDADYLQDYEPFRINLKRFPDLQGLTKELKNMGFEVTASVNPGIKIDTTYFAHADGLKNDIFVKYSDGDVYTADIAPSLNNFIDFTNPKARNWWIDNMKFLPDNGIHGYWNDMNEPAVGGSYLPDNLLFDFDGRKANALEAKNVYGMQMARSSYESALKYGEGRRPFVLTRSGFAGVQRYAAVWTGDNTAKDEYLLGGTLLNTQMGLSGIPFVGDDIGGYIGNTTKELFSRWMQVGMFAPYARNHKEAYANANEPWSYGEEAEAISKEFIGFRYRLLPYLYSKFYDASQTGMPVARSLCISDPFDEKVYDNLYQYQFLSGDAILVIPVTSQEKTKKFYLPAGNWYNLYSDELLKGTQELAEDCPVYQIPLFVKASSVILMQSLIQTTKQKPSDTLFLHVYYGSVQNNFEYYEDDGSTMDYVNGKYCKRNIRFDPGTKQIILSKQYGNFQSVFKSIQIILHGFPETIMELSANGQFYQLSEVKIKLLDGLRYLEDIYDPGYFRTLRQKEITGTQKAVTIPNTNDEIQINWK
jgi:alpha-glucosidase